MFEGLRSHIELFREYRLQRLISDGGGKVLHELTGTALFEPRASGFLHYSERVISGNLVGSRSYIYRFTGKRLEIFFDETPQRLFVALPDEATHMCGADIYEVNVAAAWPMTMRVRISGPAKEYLIVSTLR